MSANTIVGVDVGGTFTDLFYFDEAERRFRTAKVPSNRGNEDVGFLELLLVDVNNLLGKVTAAFEAKHAGGPHGIYEHADRRDGELIAVDAAQRIGDRGDEIGATADGFGDEGVRGGSGVEFAAGPAGCD